jgi:NAD(P)-dependent dehydrogenase (short-subunit alcohol dehydrogenase family)
MRDADDILKIYVFLPARIAGRHASKERLMNLHLEGKRAVVTGGSKGIGLAVARQLAAEGVDLVIAARTVSALEDAARKVAAESGRRVVPLTFDASEDSSVATLIKGAADALGGIDILVNSAAMPDGGKRPPRLADINNSMFWDDVDVKVMGYLRTAREAAPHMVRGGWGRIVNIAGLTARRTGSIVGSIRNASVAALTKNLAEELGPQGINVTVVHPAFTLTERTEAVFERLADARGVSPQDVEAEFARLTSIGRIVAADEVADVVAFMCSPRSVAINGDAIACGGGLVGSIYY